jgi:RNA polymerase sigma-70 factor (ECF subfamily)
MDDHDPRYVDPERRWGAQMRAARAGDAQAYAQLLAELSETLRRGARRELARLGVNSAEAEDVVQETLIAVHRKRHTWDQGRPFVPWVRAIARYKLIDHVRRSNRSAEVPLALFADTLPTPEPEPASVLPLARYIATLPPRQAQVVRALAIEGESIRDVSERLNMKEGAVRVAMHRGLARLLDKFGQVS